MNKNYKERIKFECLQCKKITEMLPRLVKKRKFCSRKCYYDFNKGENNHNFGKIFSIKSKIKMKKSDYHKNLKGKNNPFYGKHHSSKTRKKFSKIRKGKKHKLSCNCCFCIDKTGKKNPNFGNHKLAGKNHFNWIEGLERRYSIKFNEKLKAKVRKRDNHICQGKDCSMTQEKHFLKYKRKIEVHHIDHDKMNCSEDNLITLCKECNIKANKNVEYWEQYYKTKIMEKLL